MNTLAAARRALCFGVLKRGLLAVLGVLACTPPGRAEPPPVHDTTADSIPAPPHSRKANLKAFPYAYYTPETELAVGAGGIFTFYAAEDSILRPSKVATSAYYSTRKQYKVSIDPEIYLRRNEMYASMYIDVGDAVNKYYGTGNSSPDLGVEDYEMFSWGVKAEFQTLPKFLRVTRAGLLYEFHSEDVGDKKQNPELLADQVTGSNGGIISGAGYTAVVDTRDELFFPNTGGRYQVEFMVYPELLGSDFNYNVTTVDLRQYKSFSPDHVLAIQGYTQIAGGNVPFYRLPALGGQNRMRGYYQGRYVDRYYVMAQAEYRQYFWKRLGFVVFGGLGDVAESFRGFDLTEFKVSFGAGLRFKFSQSEKVNLRVDLGFGRDRKGTYFGLEEAF